MLNPARGAADAAGDLFLLLLCLLTLVVRAKSLRERAVTAALALACLTKTLLRSKRSAAYLRHRISIVCVERIFTVMCAPTADARFLEACSVSMVARRGAHSCIGTARAPGKPSYSF